MNLSILHKLIYFYMYLFRIIFRTYLFHMYIISTSNWRIFNTLSQHQKNFDINLWSFAVWNSWCWGNN